MAKMSRTETMTPEQEIWAVALWVEKHHRDSGPAYVGEQTERLAVEGDEAGIAMWKKVAARVAQLQQDVPPPDRT